MCSPSETWGPDGLTPTTPAAGFATVVEQMLLTVLKDVQKDGSLAMLMDDDQSLQRLALALSANW